MSRLLKVSQFADEVFTSYLSRLARANACRNTREFCLDLGLDTRALNTGDPTEIGRLADLLGVQAETITRNVVALDEANRGAVAGSCFPSRMLRRAGLRFCPHCIKDDDAAARRLPGARQYARLQWIFPQITTCFVHSTVIVEAHHVSHHRHRYDFTTLLELVEEQMPELVRRSVSRRPTEFEHFLRDVLDGRRGHGDVLDQLGLAAAITACELLGVAYLFGRDAKWRSLDEEQLVAARQAGFEYLKEGREGLHQLLDHIRSNEERTNIRGGQALYGRMYLALNENYEGTEYDLLRKMIRDYTLSVEPVLNGSDFFGKVEDSPWTSVAVVAAATGYHDLTLRRILVEFGYLQNLRQSKSDRFISIEAADAAIERINDMITLEELGALLGMKPRTARRLVDDGILSYALKPERSGGKGYDLMERYSRTQATAFWKSVVELAAAPPEERMMPFGDVAKKCGLRLSELLEHILKGRLKKIALLAEGVGFERLRLDWQEVDRLIEPAETGHIDRAEFCRRFMIGGEGFAYLVRSGNLKAERRQLRSARCRTWTVAHDDFRALDERYVTFSRLSKEEGVGVKRIGVCVREKEIPLAFPKDEAKQFVLLREHVKLLGLHEGKRRRPARKPKLVAVPTSDPTP